jgi:myo-inositol-1(or 4)-monophosphatase
MPFAEELAFARELAVNAGAILVRHFAPGIAVEMKGWADPVTVADRESEELIRSAIQRRYPDDGIDGEEEGARPGRSGRLWLIDPLDGTADYAGGLPSFAVVITLVEAARPHAALLNVTYDPIRREQFWATRGGGAFRDGEPIRTSRGDDLAGALIHLHFSNQPKIWEQSVELARRITRAAPHARNLGSTALAQAYVACGRLDGHVKVTSGKHDVVGGNLLVTEAGGKVTDLNGSPWRYPGSLLSAASTLHSLVLAEVKGLIPQGS